MTNFNYEGGNCGKCTRLERERESEEREDLLSEIFSQSRIGVVGKSRSEGEKIQSLHNIYNIYKIKTIMNDSIFAESTTKADRSHKQAMHNI